MVKSFATTVKVAVVECESVPLVPVMVTTYVFAIVELQDSVAVPELVTLVGVIAPQVRFAGTVSVSNSVPDKSLTESTLIVVFALVPVITVAGDVASIVKSVTV